MIKYNLGKAHLGELSVKYRPKFVLQELGISDKAWETPKIKPVEKENKPPEGKMQTNCDSYEKKHEEDTNLCKERFEKMNCFTPTRQQNIENPSKLFCFSPRGKLGCFSPRGDKMSVDSPSELQKKCKFTCDKSRIKLEEIIEGDDEKQYRMIEIDDDIQMLEEVDDDVVWMGDQSCCFVDFEPPEVPMIDLCGE